MPVRHDEVEPGDIVRTPGYPWTTWTVKNVIRNDHGTVTHIRLALANDTYIKRVTAGQFNQCKYDLVKFGGEL